MNNITMIMNEVKQLEVVLTKLDTLQRNRFEPREGTKFFVDGTFGYMPERKLLLLKVARTALVKIDLEKELRDYETAANAIIDKINRVYEDKKRILNSINQILEVSHDSL